MPYNKNIERVLRVHISQANKLQWVKFYNRREESLALVRLAVFLRSYSLGLIASPTTQSIGVIVPDDFTGVDARSLDLRPP